eukprot:m.26144 g.26144  ORF g.26144 m.26144 type:complete len:873 (-) comp13269_c0_seq2:185-2803(-)
MLSRSTSFQMRAAVMISLLLCCVAIWNGASAAYIRPQATSSVRPDSAPTFSQWDSTRVLFQENSRPSSSTWGKLPFTSVRDLVALEGQVQLPEAVAIVSGSTTGTHVFTIRATSAAQRKLPRASAPIVEPTLDVEERNVPSLLANALAENHGLVAVRSVAASDGVIISTPVHVFWTDSKLTAILSEATVPQCSAADNLVGLVASANGDDVWMACSTTTNISIVIRINCRGCAPVIMSGFVGQVTSLAMDAITGDVAVATTLAIYRFRSDATTVSDHTAHLLVGGSVDDTPTAVAFASAQTGSSTGGDVWIGNAFCVNVWRSDMQADRISGLQGLPRGNVTNVQWYTGAEESVLWLAHSGAFPAVTLFRPNATGDTDVWRHYAGDRWLPGGRVVDVAPTTSDGAHHGLWVATTQGIALLSEHGTTYADKARVLDRWIPQLDRYGWVAQSYLPAYGNLSNIIRTDGDNDGLWTSMLMSAYAWEFNATGSAEARKNAWAHFRAVEFLHNVTGTHGGFFARTAVKCGETHQGGDGTICPSGSPNTCGWVNSSACYAGVDEHDSDCCWTWKRDTSSDEVAGHIFGLRVLYDALATTAAERRAIARPLCATANYLVDHGLDFIDPITHKKTTWGHFSPEQLNSVPGHPEERGGNSLSILATLAAAHEMCTHDANHTRFAATFVELVTEHRYDVNLVNTLNTAPGGVAFFDFRLQFMTYMVLWWSTQGLAALPGKFPPGVPERFVHNLRRGLQRYWNAPAPVVDARSQGLGTWHMMYSLYNPGGDTDGDPWWQLRRYPVDMVQWPFHNSDRLDVYPLIRDFLEVQQQAVRHPLPADEAFGTDFMTEAAAGSVDGGNGIYVATPTPWLLEYWMARAYRFL